jgi:epoxyqueuosine reductase QueG
MAVDAAAAKTLALEAGFDRAGIVGRELAPGAPRWTQSVLILGLATLDEAFDYEIYVAYDGHRRWHKFIYEVLEARGARLAGCLRAAGLRAEHLLFDDSISIIDLRVAAVAAGLGVKGLNGLVLSPEYGPRIRFTALFTDADWAHDRPVHDYFCLNCTRCWGACPTGAIGPHGFDRSLCIAEFNPTPAMAARQRQMQAYPTPVTRLQCVACLTSCPVGQRNRVEMWVDIRHR